MEVWIETNFVIIFDIAEKTKWEIVKSIFSPVSTNLCSQENYHLSW